ncbi:MAG: MarR family transcriptional regulator [Lewinellaceae bacterium]|nr:MarR family transcriptional regulator [Lewinella sp.]MCB9278686.1 MarR family transcriptional regulator [Lewinellaceae bacterium]
MKPKKEEYCRCLYFSANALARAISRMAEDVFAGTGLHPSYAFLVMSINKYPGIPAGNLAEMMGLSPSTITRLIEKLEKKNLAKRISEGKSTLIFPTPESVAMDDQVRAAWSDLFKRYTAVLGEPAARDLTDRVYIAALQLGS